ncbi:hypothetical protein PPYR_08263 [Photinus pyralis]|uniref:Uncharacterized protein n=1 Tax=Photinus pyralis TaxID=7054 RepID=A0A5N4AIZ7_PHOPY|nr:hypothetical protein PPYR_08263 [Photinus pyralis]
MQRWLDDKNVPYTKKMTKLELYEVIKRHRSQSDTKNVIQSACEHSKKLESQFMESEHVLDISVNDVIIDLGEDDSNESDFCFSDD